MPMTTHRGRSAPAGTILLAGFALAVDLGCDGDLTTRPFVVDRSRLTDPSALDERAPSRFVVDFETSRGTFTVLVNRSLASRGADRFYNLVKNGWYDDVRFFRVIEGFVAHFGIYGDPALNAIWRNARIEDDPVRSSNRRGTITFVATGPGTRTAQLFINLADRNSLLDSQGFAPIGEVIAGMNVVDSLYAGYGEGAPRGSGPDQLRIQAEGNGYLIANFPRLDYVHTARVR
jgi:peptidyl-prolyl cis-trans isomerase A (cyclophilin A)